MQKLYDINQCALYKTGSKTKLAKVLGVSVKRLLSLAAHKSSYHVFLLPEEICPFTNKKTKARWVQAPNPELRLIHEQIQKLLKGAIPPSYAHAAIKGMSYRSNAFVHKEGACLATFDIRKFYPSTSESHVYNFFHEQLFCAPDVARLLTKLTFYKCQTAPVLLGQPSLVLAGLPTGSPLSPLLSLYANKPMFDELNQLAISNDLDFTCYVDDLTFSGDTFPSGLKHQVKNSLRRHGHLLAVDKIKFFREDQVKHVTGVAIHKNRVFVPHSRFFKARKIMEAINIEEQAQSKLPLARKLAGLLGEAAFLDKRFSGWAKHSYANLKVIANIAAQEK